MKYELAEFGAWLMANFDYEFDQYCRKMDNKLFSMEEVVKQYLETY